MGAIREDGSFFVRPRKGGLFFRALRGGGGAARDAAAGQRGDSLSEENPPFGTPRERRGDTPRPRALAVCGLKSCAACGIGCGVHGFAMSLLRFVGTINRALLRGARVTVAGPPVPAGPARHCFARRVARGALWSCGMGCVRARRRVARRGWMKQMLQSAQIYGTVAIGRCTNGRRLATSSERRW